ncbi:MAG TPA: group 1 truncated hemoglobin [Gemmatimonadaceae bacterium]|nr:group 1 truncated hemoglobin [Gemmatimonadaceae bacterium]
MLIRIPLLAGVAAALLTLSACAPREEAAEDTSAAAADTAAQPPATLYSRLGGGDAIVAVIDSFVAIVAADDRINRKFARSDVPRVKAMLVEQVCAQTGGPCTYTGRSMREAHRDMGVTEGEFNALVEDLVTTLNAFNVPQQEQNELLSALGAMKGDIVEVNTQATGTSLPANFRPAPPLPNP